MKVLWELIMKFLSAEADGVVIMEGVLSRC